MLPILKGSFEQLGAVYKGALYRKFCIDYVAKHGQDQIHVKQEDETNDVYIIRQALFAIRKEENRAERKAAFNKLDRPISLRQQEQNGIAYSRFQ